MEFLIQPSLHSMQELPALYAGEISAILELEGLLTEGITKALDDLVADAAKDEELVCEVLDDMIDVANETLRLADKDDYFFDEADGFFYGSEDEEDED